MCVWDSVSHQTDDEAKRQDEARYWKKMEKLLQRGSGTLWEQRTTTHTIPTTMRFKKKKQSSAKGNTQLFSFSKKSHLSAVKRVFIPAYGGALILFLLNVFSMI